MQTSIFLNGVSGISGEPLVSPLNASGVAAMVRGSTSDPGLVRWLKGIWRSLTSPHLGLPLGMDPLDPSQAGWAVIFHAAETMAVKDALAPLVEHRRARFGAQRVRILDYRSGEEWRSWLARQGVEPGSILPHRVPYYLLLVGDPERIPFAFEHLLSIEYAVGRLSFEQAEDYRRYAESLIAYETGASVPNGRSMTFFGARHSFDRATQLSADQLVRPLANGQPATGNDPALRSVSEGFASSKLIASAATKANLGEVFSPPAKGKPVAFLFSATHGIGWPAGNPGQEALQGALLCQDWSGPGSMPPAAYFSAADLPSDARVHGLICFLFACYGAGTPRYDSFLHKPGAAPPEIAARPFVAALPKRLLSHPNGSALAVIGHVDRAWGFSIVGSSGKSQIQPFRNAIGAILRGWPAGHALKDFRERFAALSTGLSALLEKIGFGGKVSDDDLAALWVERNDAQSYVVLGDPAVRLRVEALV